MAIDRGAKTDERQRRMFQRLQSSGLVVGNGLVIDPTTGAVSVGLAAPSGLDFSGGLLRIDLAPASGLTIDATGLYISGGSNPLTTKGDLFGFDTAAARIPVGGNNFVLTADSAQALGLKWAAPAAPAAPEGVFVVTAVKTGAYNAVIGELVRCDASTGPGAFTVTLPTAVGVAGRSIIVKNVANSSIQITIAGNGAEKIDGVSTIKIITPYASYTLISDGANWMVV